MCSIRRYIANGSMFAELVTTAARLPGAHYALGGNAPVMASRFVHEGCEVLLAAKMTPQLQRHLPSEMKGWYSTMLIALSSIFNDIILSGSVVEYLPVTF
jgi:hypothetical protein